MEEKVTRKSYRREFKLNVVKWHEQNGKIVAHTARKFKLDRKMVREWLKKAESIRKAKRFTRKVKSGRKALYPDAKKNCMKISLIFGVREKL